MTPDGLAAVPLLPLFVPILSPAVQGERKRKGTKPERKEKGQKRDENRGSCSRTSESGQDTFNCSPKEQGKFSFQNT